VMPGQGVDSDWRYLVEEVRGKERQGRDADPPWNLNPDYQRGPVWTPQQQAEFVGHVLAGGLTPPIYVQRYDSPDNVPEGADVPYHKLPSEVIDGQQRVRAIVAFIGGDIGARVFHQREGDAEPCWHTYRYADTNEAERGGRDMSSKVVYVDLAREDRLRFYLRLNSGIAHTEAELDKVRLMLAKD